MIIFVKDSRNRVLSPTTKVDWMNKMLKKNKAKLICRKLMLLQLSYPVTSKSNDEYAYFIGIDTGYSNIGFCVLKESSSKVLLLFKGEVKLRTADITKLMTERKMYRNIRRKNRRCNCKIRKFRFPRWRNRSKNKENPTRNYLLNAHLNVIKYLFKYIEEEKSIINLEYAKFDTNLLSGNGNLPGKGTASEVNLVSYILKRDNYTCLKCKNQNIPLQVHHIKFRSAGGTNISSNLATVCVSCHKKIHSGNLNNNFKLNEENFKASGMLNSVMPKIYLKLAEKYCIYKFFGYETKFDRIKRKIVKSHSNDALILSMFNVNFKNKQILNFNLNLNLNSYRRHNRAATKRIEDRRYYFKNKFSIAKNRRKRCNQEDDALIDIRRIYLDAKLKVKSGKIIYNSRTKDKPFTPGDVISFKSKENYIITGFSSTQRKAFSDKYSFKIKEASNFKVRRNSGLTIL
ncbi:MAG: RRXRR domain-containing protein [Ignavibacteriae bacterium]|nr:RRXRR domain-containing protein [Ignavibacteriota bacterium]